MMIPDNWELEPKSWLELGNNFLYCLIFCGQEKHASAWRILLGGGGHQQRREPGEMILHNEREDSPKHSMSCFRDRDDGTRAATAG